MGKWRLYSKENFVQALYFHWARSEWLKKQKKKDSAKKHEDKFLHLFNESTLNERATLEFLQKASGIPNLPEVKDYEACPIEPLVHTNASPWFRTASGETDPGVQQAVKLPAILFDGITEYAEKEDCSVQEAIRDLLGLTLGVEKPKDRESE